MNLFRRQSTSPLPSSGGGNDPRTGRTAFLRPHGTRTARVGATLLIHAFALGSTSTGLAAQELGSITGRVADASNGQPVPDVVVRVRARSLETTTDEDGNFHIQGVPAGAQTLVLSHLAYGEHTESVLVAVGRTLRVLVRISPAAIELEPLVVEAEDETGRRQRTSGHTINEIGADEIAAAARSGMSLQQLLQRELPSITVAETDRPGAPICLEYRAGGSRAPGCHELAIYMDGVRASSPSILYASLLLETVRRIELLSPLQASTRYPLLDESGALLIETRRGADQAGRRASDRWASDFELLEGRPYRWKRVLGSSLLGNAAGLTLGLLAADQCLSVDRDPDFVRVDCGTALTTGSLVLGLVLPSLSGSLAARQAGQTDRSKGRLGPPVVLGTISIAAGYVMIVRAKQSDSGALWAAGGVVLAFGTPLIQTLFDRAVRAVR